MSKERGPWHLQDEMPCPFILFGSCFFRDLLGHFFHPDIYFQWPGWNVSLPFEKLKKKKRPRRWHLSKYHFTGYLHKSRLFLEPENPPSSQKLSDKILVWQKFSSLVEHPPWWIEWIHKSYFQGQRKWWPPPPRINRN